MKKGSSLLEFIIYMGLSSVILVLCLDGLFAIEKFYLKNKDQILIENEILNSSLYIENLLKDQKVNLVDVINDKLLIFNNDNKDLEIFKNGQQLMVYFKSDNKKYLLANIIKEFFVIKKQNLIYFRIVSEKGYEVKRCIEVKRKTEEAS